MKFGKLENVDHVDFSMPADPVFAQQTLSNLERKGAPQFYVGCTGWSMKEWVGTYYPLGTKTQNYLDAYAQQFNTIELNTTHYRIPDLAMIRRWSDKTPDGFKFSPKIPQMISHSRDLGLSTHYIDAFCEVIQELGPKLGTSFLQLPPHFGPEQLPLLNQFLSKFPLDLVPLSLEFRHNSWLHKGEDQQRLLELLQEKNVGTVISDVAGRRDAMHMQLTNATVMVRFVGNELHDSDYQRVEDWLRRLKQWVDQGVQSIYFFHHQPENLLAPDMAAYFIEGLNKLCSTQLKVPQKYSDPQLSLF